MGRASRSCLSGSLACGIQTNGHRDSTRRTAHGEPGTRSSVSAKSRGHDNRNHETNHAVMDRDNCVIHNADAVLLRYENCSGSSGGSHDESRSPARIHDTRVRLRDGSLPGSRDAIARSPTWKKRATACSQHAHRQNHTVGSARFAPGVALSAKA